MRNAASKPLWFTPRPSKQLAVIILMVHLFTILCINLYSIHFSLKCLLTFLVCAHGIYVYRCYAQLMSAHSVIKFELNTRGEWLLYTSANEKLGRLLGNSVVTQYLMILNFKTEEFLRTSVVLMRDSLSQEEWRKLKVYLELN